MLPDLFMVFDVESVGLHGEGFAVGYVVVTADGKELESGRHACLPSKARGYSEGHAWVADNVPSIPPTNHAPLGVRIRFWGDWLKWRQKGAVLVADCAWPVEARFLIACVEDDAATREWDGPYPLHELASFLVAAGMDPMAQYDRLPNEPKHDPLGDARQSARLLRLALKRLADLPPVRLED